MITNSNNEELDVFLVHARPTKKLNESSGNLLNGQWVIQTIGDAATVVHVKLNCRRSVVMQILEYAVTKENLIVEHLEAVYSGVILGAPSYDLAELDAENPRYTMTFEMAVV